MNAKILFGLLFMCQLAHGFTFNDALDLAVANDKKYAAAIYEYQGAQYIPTTARAGLLPKVNYSGYTASNRLTQTGADYYGNPQLVNQNYTAKARTIQLTQPLVNLAALATYFAAQADSDAASYKLKMDYNSLVVDVANNYSSLCAYQNVISISQKEISDLERQQEIVSKKQSLGAASLADTEEVKYSKYQAQQVLEQAKTNFDQAKSALERLIGRKLESNLNYTLSDLDIKLPGTVQAAIDVAMQNNPTILHQKKVSESADYSNKKNQADYLPTIDLVAANGYQNSNSLSTVGQISNQTYVGVQINVPIFSGGETYGKERQSAYKALSERTKIDAESANLTESLSRNYLSLKNAKERASILRKQLESGKYLVNAAQAQFELGAKSLYDRLISLKKTYDVERELELNKASIMLTQIKIGADVGLVK